ncbi:MAG: DUF4123 domain-containing protein [Bryobacteraceae bacterium]
MKDILEIIASRLFEHEESGAFAILDGASVPGLLEKLAVDKPPYECLYRGELKRDLAEVAPYLVHLETGSSFAEWVIGKGWGNHWGIFAFTSSDLRALRQNFRRFLTVHDGETGKPLLFRYYDPRVLRVYLPTCNAEELETIFGPVSEFLLEGEQPQQLLRFRLAAGSLQTTEIDLMEGS